MLVYEVLIKLDNFYLFLYLFNYNQLIIILIEDSDFYEYFDVEDQGLPFFSSLLSWLFYKAYSSCFYCSYCLCCYLYPYC